MKTELKDIYKGLVKCDGCDIYDYRENMIESSCSYDDLEKTSLSCKGCDKYFSNLNY